MAISIFPRLDVTGTNRWSPLREGHWSTQGLVCCVPFGQGCGASRFPLTTTGAWSGAPLGTTPEGVFFPSDGHALGVLPARQASLQPTQRVTVLYVRQCADTTLRSGCLFGLGTGTSICYALCPWSDGNIYWDFGGNGGANRLSVALGGKTTRVEKWAFVAGARGASIWKDGVRLATQSTAITRTTVASEFQVNGSPAPGDIQTVQFFALLDAEWTGAQVAEWTANPWLMFGAASLVAGSGTPPPVARTSVVWIG